MTTSWTMTIADDGCVETLNQNTPCDLGQRELAMRNETRKYLLITPRGSDTSGNYQEETIMNEPARLTAAIACRVANLDRDRFNEHVAGGNFYCAPSTTAGRTRLFTADDMIALMLFSQLLDENIPAKRAGLIACTVGDFAVRNPTHPIVAFFETEIASPFAGPFGDVPKPDKWSDARFSGQRLKKVTLFNVQRVRQNIQSGIEYERSIIGDVDAE